MDRRSTSLAGLLDSQASHSLKELFRDENIGVAACDCVGGKFVLHSELFGEATKEKLEVARQISELIDEGFRSRGVAKIYTWAETDEQYRYNLFMGYAPTGEEVTINGVPSGFYEFEKEL